MAAKKTTRKRAKKRTSRKPAKKPQKQVHWFWKLCFWPYHLTQHFTRKWHPFKRFCASSIVFCGFAGIFFSLASTLFYGIRAQGYDLAQIEEMPARSIVYASDGSTEIGTVHGDNRLMLEFDDISEWFIMALIAREDARFYEHGAIDIRSLARVIMRYATRGKKEGASTITMQLADNSFSYPGKTIDGKLLEMAIALRIESNFSKEEILQHYMNRIFWGHSIQGIEAASRTYFEKSAADLSLSESAMLAGIIRGPNTYSPFVDLPAAINQRDVTLARMVHYEFISQTQADAAKAEEVVLRPKSRRIIHDSYAMDAIRRDLNIILEEHNISMGGLHIITTIDPKLQKSAEVAVESHLSQIEKRSGYRHQTRKQFLSGKQNKAPAYIQGALVCIENHSGAIKAIVGGRNADESKFNRAMHGRRQIGSIFKPFVYMSAFDKGLQPGGWVRDSRIRPGEIDGAPASWSPANSDKTYQNMMTVTEALSRSRNTSSVRIGNYAGINNVLNTARLVGFHQKIPTTPATYLGAFEATPLQVAQAYTVFPNTGKIQRPFIISEITDSEGNIVYPGSGVISYQAAKEGSAWNVSKTLQDVTQRGTAASLRSVYGYKDPCGGKTGTTDNYRDAWFAGYSSSLTCAVWVGMDNNQKTLNRGYGSTLAMPIWAKFMKSADSQLYPAFSLEPTMQMQQVSLCRYSSQLATPGCRQARSAYSAMVPLDLVPRHTCDNHPVRATVVEDTPPAPARAVPVR